jgi:hypothetical protein
MLVKIPQYTISLKSEEKVSDSNCVKGQSPHYAFIWDQQRINILESNRTLTIGDLFGSSYFLLREESLPTSHDFSTGREVMPMNYACKKTRRRHFSFVASLQKNQ